MCQSQHLYPIPSSTVLVQWWRKTWNSMQLKCLTPKQQVSVLNNVIIVQGNLCVATSFYNQKLTLSTIDTCSNHRSWVVTFFFSTEIFKKNRWPYKEGSTVLVNFLYIFSGTTSWSNNVVLDEKDITDKLLIYLLDSLQSSKLIDFFDVIQSKRIVIVWLLSS